MAKIYRVTLIFLLLILLVSNITFFVAGGKILSFFRLEIELESPQTIINQAQASIEADEAKFFDLNILEDKKFNNLKDFEIDLSDFSLPADLIPSEEDGEIGDIIEEIEKEPEFEIGNSNPFIPQF